MKILISTIWKGTAVIQAIKLFKPQKVYFIVDEPLEETRRSSIAMIKDLFSEIEYQQVSAKIYDIVGISKSVIDIIDKEKGNKITIHISEGRKTMSLGLLFGAYVKRKSVDAAYYITEETNTPIKLPLVELKLSSKKVILLEKIKKGLTDIEKISKQLDIKPATVYVHMKELRDEGFLDDKNQITEMGNIVLLQNN
ncbi:CRISPR locus-related DNA-binding protein [Candidatus Woesearchaeota archaeon]|nr:CRISPR locus-related DNA-binding protein [Candidatus Woesearchaeota archaeon]